MTSICGSAPRRTGLAHLSAGGQRAVTHQRLRPRYHGRRAAGTRTGCHQPHESCGVSLAADGLDRSPLSALCGPRRYRIIATLAAVLIETLGDGRAYAARAPGFRRHQSDDASQCSDGGNGREAASQTAAQGGALSRPDPEI